jgi:hypothetical protein
MQTVGFLDGKIIERFDCYEGTSVKVKLSKDLYVQGVNFFARKPETLAGPDYLPTEGNRAECLSDE